MAEIVVRPALLEAQTGRADPGQLPLGAQPRQGQIRVDPAGEDQMQVGRQMLQEEAQGLVNG